MARAKRKSALKARKRIRKLFAKKKTKKIVKPIKPLTNDYGVGSIIKQMEDVDKYGAFDIPSKPIKKVYGVPHPDVGNGSDEKEEEKNDIINNKDKEAFFKWINEDLPKIPPGKDESHQIVSQTSQNCVFNNAVDFSQFVEKQKISQRIAKTVDKQNPNIGVLVSLWKDKNGEKIEKKTSTGCVIGTDRQMVIACAHSMYYRGRVADEYIFFRGLDQQQIPKIRDNQLVPNEKWKSYYEQNVYRSLESKIHPSFRSWSKTPEFDVGVVWFNQRIAKAVLNVGFIELRNGILPKYCRIDGYPVVEEKEAMENSVLRNHLLNSEDKRFTKLRGDYKQAKMYGAAGEVIKCQFSDFDWIGHTVYASEGQSGSPLFITDKHGQYFNAEHFIFALHQQSTTIFGCHGEICRLQATLLTTKMCEWIFDLLPKGQDGFPSICTKNLRSGYINSIYMGHDPKNDKFFNQMKAIDKFGVFDY